MHIIKSSDDTFKYINICMFKFHASDMSTVSNMVYMWCEVFLDEMQPKKTAHHYHLSDMVV